MLRDATLGKELFNLIVNSIDNKIKSYLMGINLAKVKANQLQSNFLYINPQFKR